MREGAYAPPRSANWLKFARPRQAQVLTDIVITMRKLIAALLAGLLASSTVVFADEVSGLARTSVEKAIHETSHSDRQQAADAQQTTSESRPWVERHPVWFGLIAGAGVGAVWGASSCRKGCLYGPG